nr:glutamic acid-rich protein-like [Tanacetum cinerariifolium]
GVDCLPNEEIFIGLAHIGYEKPSTKLTFYKDFFSSQWKFLIHTILQSLSAKRMSWNEFSFAMASAVICLSIDRKFNFSKYIFDSLIRNVDSSSKFYMYPRVGKGFSGVETPLFEGMLVAEEIEEHTDAEEQIQALDACAALTRQVKHLEHDKVAQNLDITKLKARVKKLDRANKVKTLKLKRLRKVGTSQRIASSDDTIVEDVINQGRMIDELDRDEYAALMGEKEEEKKAEEVKDIAGDKHVKGRQAEIYQIDMDHAAKVLSMQEEEPEVTLVSAASTIIPASEPKVPTAAPVKVAAASTGRRRGVVIRDPEEESTTITPADTKSKDKGKSIMGIDWDAAIEHVKQKAKEDPFIQRYQVIKKSPQTKAQARRNMIIYLKNTVGFRLDYFKGKSYDDIRQIFKAKFNINIEFLLKAKEKIEEEENRALESINETPAQKAAKRRRLNKEDKDVEEIKQHLEIVPDEDDDVYTEATPLARKVPVVDYQIIHLNNKPRYKIIRADGTHQLYVSFITLLKNFYREDLESLWSLVKERFSTSKPNNFSDDYLLTILRAMFRKPNGQDNVWKSQRSVHGQEMVKS